MITRFKEVATLDIRSLSLLRIGVSLVLLLDLFLRAGDMEAHYTNDGVLPLPALFKYAWNPSYFSIYTGASSEGIISLLFLVNVFCIIGLLIGFRTRLFTFLCWLFLLSLHNRNPLIQQAGDDLIRILLFWGMFLPWGNRFSIDAFLMKRNANEPEKLTSWACIGYLLLLFSVYFFSALHKSSPEWTTDFTALYYALSLDMILFPAGKLLYQQESLLKALTAITFYVELLLPFVLFLPFWVKGFRVLFLLAISFLHLGIAMSINVGLFPLICTIAMLGLIPSGFYEYFKKARVPVSSGVSRSLRFIRSNLKAIFPHFNVTEGELTRANRTLQNGISIKSVLKSAFTVFVIFYMLIWNIRTLKVEIPEFGLTWIGHFLRIDQYWSMFAPAVFKDDGWFVLEGATEQGSKIDIKRGGADVDYSKPAYVAGTYKNDRWRKYSENILFISNSHYRPYFCRYMLHQWNDLNQKKITRLEVIFMKIPSLPDYKEDGPFKEVLCTCEIKAPQ